MDQLSQIGSAIMTPLYWVTSVILTGFHTVFGKVLGADSGWAWALSIVGLTVVIRAALIPLFVRQIKASRNMQLLQPKVKELQKKYGHDRERMAQETMKLYKESGTNPFASCMPLLLQAPIFFALFRLINHAVHDEPKGVLTPQLAHSFEQAQLLGVRISDTFTGAETWHVKVFTLVLVAVMTVTTFTTQRQLMRKNMPPEAMSGQYAQQQKMLLYVLPVVFAVGGIAFPVGVLFYWVTSNAWTMCQQFYVIRNNPAPNTPAFKAKQDRDAAKRARKQHGRVDGEPAGASGSVAPGSPASGDDSDAQQSNGARPSSSTSSSTQSPTRKPRPPTRNQPKKTPRSKRRGASPGSR